MSYFVDDMPETLEGVYKKVNGRKTKEPMPEWAIEWRKWDMSESELLRHPPEPPLPTCYADLD